MQFYEFVGLVGVVATLAAFFLLQIKVLHSDDLAYTSLNAVGALMILYSLFYDRNLAAVIIEISWVFISAFGIYKGIRRHMNRH